MDLTDEAIVANFRQTKDPAYFTTLVRRYEHRIYNAAFRILGDAEEAHEVVQDTCIKLHQNLNTFKLHSSFAAWLFRIAHNTCLDKLRARQRRRLFSFLSFDPQSSSEESIEEASAVVRQAADPGLNPADKLDLSEQGSMVAQSLKQLPENQRTVVVLHDIEGLSYQEIAEIVGASMGTVRSRLHYGRLKLRELLEPYFERDPAPASR